MSKGKKKYAEVKENVLVVKKGYLPLPVMKGAVLPIHTEDKGSGFVVLLVGERGVTLQSRSVSILGRKDEVEYFNSRL
jgi:hypothetical protein